MMPVVIRRNVFSAVVGVLQIVGLPEFCYRFSDAAYAAKVVAVHVTRVRNCVRKSRISFAMLQRGFHLSDVFIGVNQIMMRSEVVRRYCEHLLIEGGRGGASALPSPRRCGLL